MGVSPVLPQPSTSNAVPSGSRAAVLSARALAIAVVHAQVLVAGSYSSALVPVRWLTRVPVVALYAVGIYALLLTENIYNVAADRTIALLRAAHSVGFLLTLITYFLLVQTVMAFRFPFYVNAFFVGIISFLLVLQSLWSVVLEENISRRVVDLSLAIAVVLTELSWLFSFWPTQSTLIVLMLTTTLYSTVGMAQQYLVEKLYKKTVTEFFSLSVIVFVIIILATHWRGNL